MTQSPQTPVVLDSKSSLLEKLPDDLRRRFDQAVIDRDPPTYRACYARFNLAAHGVSYTAFFYYARRLRLLAESLHLAQLAAPDAPDPVELLPAALAHRLLDAAVDEAASPRALHRLADAWRIVVAARLALQRHAAGLDDARRKKSHEDVDRMCHLVRQYARLRQDELRIAQSDIDARLDAADGET